MDETTIKCDNCEEEFTDEESYESHRELSHENDSFQFIDSRDAVDEQEFVRINGKREYNPNPNAGLYDNKLFREGSAKERTSILGEHHDGTDHEHPHEEANEFTLEQFKDNEEINYHSENALELVKLYGTPDEIKEVEDIVHRHHNSGRGIDYNDRIRRDELLSKYYPRLENDSSEEDKTYQSNYSKSLYNKWGESIANEDDLMRGFFPNDEDYKSYQRSMDKALGLKSVDSHYKSDGITCGICGETPSDKREHLRKHYGAYFDETVASESKANEVPLSGDKELMWTCPKCSQQINYIENERFPIDHLRSHGLSDEQIKQILTLDFSNDWDIQGIMRPRVNHALEYNLGKQSSDVYDIIIYDKETGDWEMSMDVDNQKDLTYYKNDFKQEANRLNDEAGYKKYAVKVKNEWDSLNWSQDFSEEKVKAKEVAEKLAYYFSKGDKPIDWNDNEISNDAEKILQETYGITTKKPEVAKEVAHESHSPTQDRIIDRKLAGVKSDGIIHELMLWENMSEEQATKAVESTEIPVMDSVSFSLFNKKYSELNEVEQQEIKLYGGEAKKVNKEKDGGIV